MAEHALRFRLLPIAALFCVGSCLSTEGYYRNQDAGASGSAGSSGTTGSAGVTVGRVASIRLDPKLYQGVVELAIQRDVQFPTDSSLRILTSGLLGDQYIGVEPGASEKMWAPGDEIKQTQSAVVLESLISQFLFNKAADAGSTAPAASAPGGGKK